ncbi:hypothetical protein SCLCIDRAFT_670461 [Scleroderma citrinum Foug A]|uniref:Uncharacterized protein n=1 Tax=Scleroderma citrinum Foug A TaxID=1036808 RepID=A0A0C3E604_9AGAM|nr:hypothetical protein SCLCIDRAFT_670461 [Scleroderma citrinum Foug A]
MDDDAHYSGTPTEAAVARTDYSSSSACTIPKRTRSQLTAPNDILHVPLARSPLKDARAHARAQAQATLSKKRLQPHTQGPRQGAGSNSALPSGNVESEGGRGSMQNTEATGVATSQMEKPHDDDVPMSIDIRGSRDDDQHKHAGPTGAKKRASPDTEPARLTSPSAERNPKRAKFEAMKALSKGEEVAHPGMEYEVPLRDDEGTSPRSRTRRFVRASSVVSPKPASIFPPRAKSVPLEAEDIPPPLDLTAVSPSPRRSPKKGIEIRRAPSQPPPDEDSMDVDRAEPSSSDLSYFTNVTSFSSPRKYPTFNYAVNFATPLTASRHTGHHLIPPSPLTPLPPTPFTARLPNAGSSLAQRAHSILRRPRDIDMSMDVPTSPPDDSTPLDSSPRPQHEPTQLVSPDVSRPPSAASTLSDLSSIDESSDPPSKSQELMPPPPVPFNRALPTKTNEVNLHLTIVESDATSTQYFTNPTAGSSKKRPTVIGGMKPKPGSTVSSALRRVTRSAMKETEGDLHRGHEGANGSNSDAIPAPTPSTSSTSVAGAAPPISTKVQPAKRTSRSKPPALQKRSASSSALVSTSRNSKQTSLFSFIGVKPAVITSTTSSSKPIPPPSPSKIPLPLSPVKRTPGKPRSFTISSTGVTTNTDIFGGTSRGRALSTLSHALEKLSVPPPSRPNTSLGFLSADDPADDGAPTDEDKGSAKDDASAPSAPSRSADTNRSRESGFARPTASSLRRAATVSGPVTKQGIGGSSVVARMQRHHGVVGQERALKGIFSRAGERASKNPTLPTVAGSPVKGSCLVESEVTTANECEDDHGHKGRTAGNVTVILDGQGKTTCRDFIVACS